MSLLYPILDSFYYRNTSKLAAFLHTHTKYELFYFHQGKCQYILGDHVIELRPGDLIILNGIQPHGPMTDPDQLYERSNLLFDRNYILPLLQQPRSLPLLAPFELLRSKHWRLNRPQQLELERLLTDLHQFYLNRTDPISHQRLTYRFLDLLLFLYQLSQASLSMHASLAVTKQQAVESVTAYIDEHYTQPLTLDTMAQATFVSKSYLVKSFKTLTGMTVFQYVHHRRISRARIAILLNPDTSLTEIGLSVGYKQPAHFSRNFKRILGISPEQFRRSLG